MSKEPRQSGEAGVWRRGKGQTVRAGAIAEWLSVCLAWKTALGGYSEKLRFSPKGTKEPQNTEKGGRNKPALGFRKPSPAPRKGWAGRDKDSPESRDEAGK